MINFYYKFDNSTDKKFFKKCKKAFKTDNYQYKIKPELKRFLAVVFFTFIYGIGMSWFLQASPIRLYTGGIPGVGQLIVDCLKFVFKVKIDHGLENTIISVFVIVGNIPILLLGWFAVSKKFVIYSFVSIIIQSTVLGLLSIDLFKGQDPLMLTIAGGVLLGIGVGGALRYGTSTGGFDILSQYLAFKKKGKSVGNISTIINVSITLIGAFFALFALDSQIPSDSGVTSAKQYAGLIAVYTITRLIISMLVMDKIHTTYNFIEINIITRYEQEVCEGILKELGHGVTILDGRGGYGYTEKSLLYLVVYSFERLKVFELTKQIDRDAFIVTKNIRSLNGNFRKKTIA